MIDTELLKCILTDYGWELDEYQPDKYYWRYRKDDDIFDFWFTTGTCRMIKKDITKYYRNKTLEEITEIIK
jgi:hypothetical protein